MFPVSRASSGTIAAGVVMVVLGLFLVASVSDRTAVALASFGFTVGFLLLGFGVIVIVAAVVRSRKR